MMMAHSVMWWARSSVSRRSSSRIRRCALVSRSLSVTKVGAVGDTGLPLKSVESAWPTRVAPRWRFRRYPQRRLRRTGTVGWPVRGGAARGLAVRSIPGALWPCQFLEFVGAAGVCLAATCGGAPSRRPEDAVAERDLGVYIL